MQQNPLFPGNNDGSQLPDYLRTSSTVPHGSVSGAYTPLQPIPSNTPAASDTSFSSSLADDGRDSAADLIRQKLANIYADTGSDGQGSGAAQPDQYATGHTVTPQPSQPLSKHQQFMRGLHASGRSTAEIHSAWHSYYAGLPDHEKHEVWQEFYARSNSQPAAQDAGQPASFTQTTSEATNEPQGVYHQPDNYHPQHRNVQPLAQNNGVYVGSDTDAYQAPKPTERKPKADRPRPNFNELKTQAKQKLLTAGKLSRRGQYFHSLGFGLACGVVVLVVFMFSFFNEVIISPFIQPGSKGVDTPVIVDPANGIAASSKTPEVIIPKINVQIPVDYSQTTTSEAAIETALESGVVHYPTTVMPGQNGNAAFFGHSSNNIFNPGHYKFAFVLLHTLTEGDTFYLTYNGKTYAYEVISHQIVQPSDVAVLGPVAGQTATATLITCDPPGTSLHRLVVVGKQISPDPSGNTAPAAPNPATPTVTATTTNLPGNGPTLLSRLWHSIF